MRLFFMMCLSGVVLATPFLFARAEDPPGDRNPAAETESLTTEPAEQQDSAEDEKEQELRKRKLEIGMIFTGIIVVMGVFLVVMILLYGRRTRRQLATGRAASAPRDELWYLKQRRDTSAADDSKSEREGDSE